MENISLKSNYFFSKRFKFQTFSWSYKAPPKQFDKGAKLRHFQTSCTKSWTCICLCSSENDWKGSSKTLKPKLVVNSLIHFLVLKTNLILADSKRACIHTCILNHFLLLRLNLMQGRLRGMQCQITHLKCTLYKCNGCLSSDTTVMRALRFTLQAGLQLHCFIL